MGDFFQIGVITQFICAVFAATTIVYLLLNGKKDRITRDYIILLVFMFLWCFFEIVDLISQTPRQEMLALKLKFLPICVISVSWFIFALNISRVRLYESRWFKTLVYIPPIIFYLFIVTNEYHHLFFIEIVFKTSKTRGPVFWLHTAYSYIYLLSGSFIMFYKMMRELGSRKKQVILLVSAILIPLIANVLMLTETIPYMGFDLTPQLFLITFILFAIAVYRLRFLNLVPVASRSIIEDMQDGVIVIDNDNLIASFNRAVLTHLPGLNLKAYDEISVLTGYILSNIVNPQDVSRITEVIKNGLDSIGYYAEELVLKTGSVGKHANGVGQDMPIKSFRISVQSIFSPKMEFNGRVVIFSETTRIRNLMDEIRQKNIALSEVNEELKASNEMLMEANRQLQAYSDTVQELVITRERNRMAREMHDTIGHTMTLLITLLQSIQNYIGPGQTSVREKVCQCIELSRQCLFNIRQSLRGLFATSYEKFDVDELLQQLIRTFEQSGLKVDYSFSGEAAHIKADLTSIVYRICQESMTNSMRHGKAGSVTLTIKSLDNAIKIYIFDDGCGCGKIIKGFGIKGMEQRVKEINGSIRFGSDGETGFHVIAELPVYDGEEGEV